MLWAASADRGGLHASSEQIVGAPGRPPPRWPRSPTASATSTRSRGRSALLRDGHGADRRAADRPERTGRDAV